MKPDNKYTQMQQAHYDSEALHWAIDNRDPVVGSFDLHNAWDDYNVYLFKNIDTAGKIALDFGCGPGRCIVNFAPRFQHIDGADISQVNLDKAQLWFDKNPLPFDPILYKVNGVDLSEIADHTYDIVYSTICMQHICVYDIRVSLMKEFFRVLKPTGILCVQMGFGPDHPFSTDYYANHYDAVGTNGAQDVRVEDPAFLHKDLNNIGFIKFEFDIRPMGPGDGHNNWIFFRSTKDK